MKYDCNYFIKKFEKIPVNLWTGGMQGTNLSSKQKCAYGHCGASPTLAANQPEEAIALSKIINNGKDFFIVLDWLVVHINDGTDENYQQYTPKERILAALYDIRDKELSEANVMAVNKIVNENILVVNQ